MRGQPRVWVWSACEEGLRLFLAAAIWLAATLGVSGVLSAQNIGIVAGSTQPVVQLTGEHFQIFSNGLYFSDVVPGMSLSNAGVLGEDLGTPVVYPDKIVFLFGDSLATYVNPSNSRHTLAEGSGADDSIGYIPNSELAACSYIATVNEQLLAGNRKPEVSAAGCPSLRFYLDPGAGPFAHKFKSITIAGLDADEGTGPYQTPSGALDWNGALYMYYVTKYQEATPHYALKSILAKADQPHTAWGDATPPTFTKLQTISSHPLISDPGNPPSDLDDIGKFMFNSPVLMDTSAFDPAQLPAELAGTSKLVFVFGSSWRYNRSGLYLAVFSASDIEAGPSSWFYFTGMAGAYATWGKDEKLARSVIPGLAGVGNHSVVWNPALKSFVFMYGNLVARFAPAPWGQWGDPILLLTPQGDWASRLIHHPGQDTITRSIVPIYNSAGKLLNLDGDAIGVPYSPYLIDKYTANADGSVTLYYLMSTWSPYQVWLVSSRFIAGSSDIPSSKRALPQVAFGGGWYTGLYFYNSNSVPVSASVRLFDAAGQPLAIPDAGQTGAILGISAKGIALLEFPNRGTLRQGWADVSLPDGVTGYGIFRQSVVGRFDQEAVVPLALANLSGSSLVFDDSRLSTSVAFANPTATTSFVTHIARDEAGQILGTSSVELWPRGRQSVPLRTIIPSVAGKRGSVESSASPGALAALGLRFNSSAFTSIPIGASTPPGATAALPQIAFGGGWYTALQFANTSETAASVSISFYDQNGQPLAVPSAGGTSVTLDLTGKGAATLEMANTGELNQGWARVSLPGGVIGYGIFRQSAPGREDQEAVVPLTKTDSAQSTLIFDDTAFTTSVAFVNPRQTPVQVTMSARHADGQEVGSTVFDLAPNARRAADLRTLLPGIAGKRGSVVFDAGTGAVAVLGFRFNTSAFTSIPAESR